MSIVFIFCVYRNPLVLQTKRGHNRSCAPTPFFQCQLNLVMKYAVYVFTPLCRAFYGTTFSFLFVASVSRQMVNRSFLLLREVYFVAEGKSLQAWIYFFCLMGTFFPDVACVVSRLFGLSFDGIVLHSLYALVVGIAHLAQFNKGLKIVWIKTKLAASADNSHSSFLSERQLPCLADIGSVLPAAVFNPPCRGFSTFHICHGTLQSLRCMAASRFLMSPLRAVPSSSG